MNKPSNFSRRDWFTRTGNGIGGLAISALVAGQFIPQSLFAVSPVAHRFLCTDHKGGRVAILSAKGDIEWEHSAEKPQDCWLLPNGNVLFSQMSGAVEVSMENEVVWEYKAPVKAKIHSCQPLPSGNVLVGESFMSRILEIGRGGEIVKKMQIKSSPKIMGHQFRGVRRSKNSHYWACLMDEKKIVELCADGSLLRELPFDGQPGAVVNLPNGHLIVSLWDKTRIVELDENLNTVWEIVENEIPGNPLRIPMGINRLPNGNTVIGNYLGHGFEGKQPMLFEITPDKEVVWEFSDHLRFKTVCQMQILGTVGGALQGEVYR